MIGRTIEVYADRRPGEEPHRIGVLRERDGRSSEIFDFTFESDALENADLSKHALDLARSVAGYFRIKDAEAKSIVERIAAGVRQWSEIAAGLNIGRGEQDDMADAFRRTTM